MARNASAFPETLTDLTRWDAASGIERRAAATWVDESLEDFALDRMETFLMGSPDDEEGRGTDEAQREVQLTQPFLIARTEVSQSAWVRVTVRGPPRSTSLDGSVHSVSNDRSLCVIFLGGNDGVEVGGSFAVMDIRCQERAAALTASPGVRATDARWHDPPPLWRPTCSVSRPWRRRASDPYRRGRHGD